MDMKVPEKPNLPLVGAEPTTSSLQIALPRQLFQLLDSWVFCLCVTVGVLASSIHANPLDVDHPFGQW